MYTVSNVQLHQDLSVVVGYLVITSSVTQRHYHIVILTTSVKTNCESNVTHLRKWHTFVGLPAYLQRRLQTVLNAAARLVFRLRRHDHVVSDALANRVNFKLALMAYRVLNCMAPPYLNQLVPVSSLPGRRRLRSSFTLQPHIPQYRLSTAGRRSFPVAASIFWNALSDDIFPTTLKDFPVSPVISGHHSLNFRIINVLLSSQNAVWRSIETALQYM